MITRFPTALLIAAFAGLFTACSADQEPGQGIATQEPPVQQQSQTGQGIPWFQGSIEDAFATAERDKKPVFLYWGAQWCPPCQELKSTIFRRLEFIEQSQLFVPVYLDGDTERAQKYGERFGVQGYPTVIIFNPRGVEITRIPGGMNIEQYLDVLELALNALQPVSDLVQAVKAGQAIRDDDWRLLASYSWNQDRDMALDEAGMQTTLQDLASACPERLAATKSRLQMLAILSWAIEAERDESLAEPHGSQIERILTDPMISRDNLNVFIAGGADIVNAMATDEQRVALRNRIAALLASAIQDQSIGVLTRIDAIYGWVEVNRTSPGENEAMSVEQQDWVKAQVAATRSQIDRFQQHAALNSLAGLFLSAGLEAEARAALREGMEVSRQPYYFMSGMAHLETQAGNSEAAISWHKKAWDAAEGPATRVQWGSSYIFALIELHADDIETINATGTAVLGELAQQKGALYQRNSGRMDRLSRSLLGWLEPEENATTTREERRKVLDNLRSEMDRLCTGSMEEGEAAATCTSFLAST